MQNLTPTHTNNQPRVVGQMSPEVAETLRRLRASESGLESEYGAFADWETRCEMADELRGLLDELDDAEADVIARVAEDLDSELEDFSQWDTRCDAASRVRLVIRSIEKEVTANA